MDKEKMDLDRVLHAVMPRVQKDLRIRLKVLFSKIAILHLASSLVTLSLCQQFGIKLMGGFDLMHVFMGAGLFLCQIFCGAFYFGSSTLLIAVLLPRHEFVWVKNHAWSLGLVTLVSSMVLLSIMGEAFGSLYLAAWFVGAALTGSLVFVLMNRVRRGPLNLWDAFSR
jgi:hypothetical protein